jgi:predicted DNA-binding transcriptional regulator YafY
MGHSAAFRLFHRAILQRQQVTFRYQGHYREVCPYILGHKDGREAVLVYQFGGTSSRGLPPEGEWRCFLLSEVRDPDVRHGQWHGDAKHSRTQQCVDVVFVDVNIDVPNQPGRRFGLVGD